MYQVQLFKRNKDGKKDELAFTIQYPSQKQANIAIQTLKSLKASRRLVPCDCECEPTGAKVCYCANYIVA